MAFFICYKSHYLRPGNQPMMASLSQTIVYISIACICVCICVWIYITILTFHMSGMTEILQGSIIRRWLIKVSITLFHSLLPILIREIKVINSYLQFWFIPFFFCREVVSCPSSHFASGKDASGDDELEE